VITTNNVQATASRLMAQTKLYWGVAIVFLAGVLFSPVAGDGTNIFLEAGNLTDVLRQVSIIGIMAVGMTLVILIAGIDLSVGTVMALGSTLTAMLLTLTGWSRASIIAIPVMTAVTFLVCYMAMRPLIVPRLPGRGGTLLSGLIAVALAALVCFWSMGQLDTGFGVLGVLVAAACVGLVIGATSGVIVAKGGLQPFIATLAMMVAVLGAARLMAGQDQSVYAVYTGVNATQNFDILRASIWGIPVPGFIFLIVVLVFSVLMSKFRFGRHIYALGGNEAAAHLSGINVAKVKIIVFSLSAMLSSIAGVLYAAQYRQGKPDAGTGLELDAIAAVVIGGTNLMGGRGTVPGTLAGVLIFGLLSNILQLNNIDSNTQLVLKGAIIVAAVLLQEGNIRQWLSIRRGSS
jgi:simple sugar transport system permease protein